MEHLSMATPVQFKAATTAANEILRADRAKLQWSKLPISDMPEDIQALAYEALQAELNAQRAKSALQAALDDKVQAPAGKRLVVTLGRQVSESTDSVLVAWAAAAVGSTRTISFNEFVRG